MVGNTKRFFLYSFVIIIAGVLFFAIRIIIGGIIIGSSLFNYPTSYEKVKKDFDKDYDLLITVANYLKDSGYENVYIPDIIENGQLSIAGNIVAIKDIAFINAINNLKKSGCSVIEKNNNTISFLKWSNLDNGRGIVYSIDGNEPVLQFLTKIEILLEPNWYYYEEDFNKWKKESQFTHESSVYK